MDFPLQTQICKSWVRLRGLVGLRLDLQEKEKVFISYMLQTSKLHEASKTSEDEKLLMAKLCCHL